MILGGTLAELGNGRFGHGPHFVVEADEYDHMFLGLRPQMAVITNIEHDHPDMFPTAADIVTPLTNLLRFCRRTATHCLCHDPGRPVTGRPQPAGVPHDRLRSGPTQRKQPDMQALDVRPNQMGGSGLRRRQVAANPVELAGIHQACTICATPHAFGGPRTASTSPGHVRPGQLWRRQRRPAHRWAGGVTIIDDYAITRLRSGRRWPPPPGPEPSLVGRLAATHLQPDALAAPTGSP